MIEVGDSPLFAGSGDWNAGCLPPPLPCQGRGRVVYAPPESATLCPLVWVVHGAWTVCSNFFLQTEPRSAMLGWRVRLRYWSSRKKK